MISAPHLRTTVHPKLANLEQLSKRHRQAARAIAVRGEDVLLVFTERYQDFSFPGGGVDEGENIEQALVRELLEETGAQQVTDLAPYGIYEEFWPWWKDDADVLHMFSYYYTCSVIGELGETQLEDYEIKNGMSARWVNIHQAIAHNENTIATSEKKGLSIERETYVLKCIANEILSANYQVA